MIRSQVVSVTEYPCDTVLPLVSPVVFVVRPLLLPSLYFLSDLASEPVARRLGILSDCPVDTRVLEQVNLISVYDHLEILSDHLAETMVLAPENLALVHHHETWTYSSLVRPSVGHRVIWICHASVDHLVNAIDHASVCHHASAIGHAFVDLVLPAS